MIASYIGSDELSRLTSVHPLIKTAISEMIRLKSEGAADGKYVIDGDDLFINLMTYENHIESECLFEAHRNYIDIQMLLAGEEVIGFTDRESLKLTTPYTANDYELFAMTDKPYDRVILRGDRLVIILPPEPHAPGIAIDKPQRVRKMVAKIKM